MTATTSTIVPTEGVDHLFSRLQSDLPRAERSQTVRQILHQAAKTEDKLQLRMAELLFEAQERRYWRDWGFGSFREFVEAECGFGLRKAQQLVEVYKKFVVELAVPPEQMRRLEWSKAALVAGLIRNENRDELLRDVERLSYRDLQERIEAIRKKSEASTPEAPPETSPAAPPPSPIEATPPTASGWRLPRPAEDEFFVPEEVWEQLCYAMQHGENVLLTGPSGCGKSEICYLLASAAGKRVEAFNFGAMTEPRTSLIGNTHFDRRNGTRFVESRFVRAVQDPNACLLLDELSRAGRDAFNILLPLLDGQRYLALDEEDDAPVVHRVPGVTFLATANIGMEYTGTEQLDLALKDRFPINISMDFPPRDQERAILRKRCDGLTDVDARRLLRIAHRQRELTREGEFVGMISTRALLAAGRQIAGGVRLENAVRFCILNHFSNDGGDTSERARLLQIFQKGEVLTFPRTVRLLMFSRPSAFRSASG
jgi:nitric oxide reductase NorQ protein